MPLQIFLGYSGRKGMQIANDMAQCLQNQGMIPVAAIPGVGNSGEFIESEEEILSRAARCDAAVMVCNRRSYSQKFKDEVETVTYEAKIPVIALVQKRTKPTFILRRRHAVKFEKHHHLEKCQELVETIRSKTGKQFGADQLTSEQAELRPVDYPGSA